MGVKKFDVVSAVLVQIFRTEACVVCKNNLVQCVPQGSLDMLDCCDLVVTFAFEKVADGRVDGVSIIGPGNIRG